MEQQNAKIKVQNKPNVISNPLIGKIIKYNYKYISTRNAGLYTMKYRPRPTYRILRYNNLLFTSN